MAESEKHFERTVHVPSTTSTNTSIVDAKDWTSVDDEGNPRNFSLQLKLFSVIAGSGLAFVSTLAASIYSPSAPYVADEFNVGQEVAILGFSLYNVGLACGPLIGAPVSETLGRKAVILVTTPVFALFTIGAGFSQNIASLCICRFFAGAFAAPAVGNASATIQDYTHGPQRGIPFALYYSSTFFGAVLGPLIGGFVVKGASWRWTQWTIIFFILAFYIPVLLVPETYKKAILQRRAKALGIEGPPTVHRTFKQGLQYFGTKLLLRPMHMLVTEPIVSLVCLDNTFLFGLTYTFVVASPWVYETIYGFNLTGQSLSFLGLICGVVVAPIPLFLIDRLIYQPRYRLYQRTEAKDGQRFPPEHRLYPSLISSFLLPIALFIFAWTARSSIHWMVPVVFQGVALMSSLLVYSSANVFMMDSYGPLYGASASSAAMLTRYGLSAAFPLFALQMYKALGVGWATSILGFCALLTAPVPWFFWKYGEGLRTKRRYETST